jgi:membrane protease YdiL (CAAX protease family)
MNAALPSTPQHATLTAKPGAWVDLGLTLPIFLLYQCGVVFLKVRNGTDVLTGELLRLSEGNRAVYLLVTASIGVVFAGVFAIAGRGQAYTPRKFLQIGIEGIVYAVLMRVAAVMIVGKFFAGTIAQSAQTLSGHAPAAAHASIADQGPFVGFIMSLGAGFYEELAFRAILFGLGAKIFVWIFAHERVGLVGGTKTRIGWRGFLVMLIWATISAAIFSGVHYIGTYGDPFKLTSFVFRVVLGLALTLIYVTRGFAAAVWSHALYDVGVLVLPGI